MIILAIIGVVEFVNFLNGHPRGDSRIIAAVAGSLIGLGRVHTMSV